ncbi:hypothetical protein C0992_009787 [Termitomyces sp. T32_za158]|nr:hypothetical protein C0992_009787 [Termitomyces sp. T32_za158]
MSLDDYLDYFLLILWLLSSFCSPSTPNDLLAMVKSSGLSVSGVLYCLTGFLATQYLFKRFFRTSHQEKPTASSMRELAWAVLYAIIIREWLPSMFGTLMATNTLQRWICDLAGLVTLVLALAPSFLFPSVSHVSNVVNAIELQDSVEVSLQEERTLVQTPSPSHKKEKIILVGRLPTPPHDRILRRPVPSQRSSPAHSPRDAGDRIRPVIPLTSHHAELFGANFCDARDCSIEDSFSGPEVLSPVANRVGLTSINLAASGDRIGNRSSSITERFDNSLPQVIVEHAREGFSLEHDTFSLTDLLSGEPGDNLMENQDMEMILNDISGDGESEFLSFMPEENVATILDRSPVATEDTEKALGQVSTFDYLLAPRESEEASTSMVIPEELSVQARSIPAQQPDCVPLITVSDVDDSYGPNDTFSLTDLLSSLTGKEDNLLNVKEMRDDLANISMPGTLDSAALSPPKTQDTEVCVFEYAEERGTPRAGLCPDASINEFVSSPERGNKRKRTSEDIIYTSCGPFPMAKMPYELFSPASMRASEVAGSLLSDEGRIRCADWRASVDRGQQLLRVEQFAEEIDKDLAEFDKMQATLRSLMREHGLETSATPPRVPSVQITQASPEKHNLDRSPIIQRPYQFPAFLDKAVPLTIDFHATSCSLIPSESIDSMYDPDFPGLDGKQADRYPTLNSDWPSDFPTEADTSDEWKLTQEMIDFWAARKAKMEAENPPPPVNINDLSMEVDDGGENDRSFGVFEDSMEYNYEDEPCLPGNSRLKCLGWRYEVVPVSPKPPQDSREHLVETVGNAILSQMYSVYSMYGKQDPDPAEEESQLPSPPPPSPPRAASPLPETVVEPDPAPASVAVKKSALLRRQSTSKVVPTMRALRPRPSVTSKTAAPERPTARVSDPNVLSKLRPRASIATATPADSRATIEKKVVRRQSLPLSAPKAAPRQSLPVGPRLSVPPRQSLVVSKAAPGQSLPQSSVAPKVSVAPPRTSAQSLAVPKAAPRQSLPQSSDAPKVSVAPPRTTRQSLAVPKVAPRMSLPQSSAVPKVSVVPPRTSAQSLAVPKAAPRQSLSLSSDASKVSVVPPRTTRQSLVALKAAPRQSLSQPSDAPKVSVAPPRTTRQSLGAPKVAPRMSLPQSSVVPKVSVAPPRTTRQSLTVPKVAAPKQPLHIPAPAPKQTIQADSITKPTLRSASQIQQKTTTSLPASKTQTQPKSLAAVKRIPLAPIQTNVPHISSPSTAAATQKSISRLPPPKRMSLAPPPTQVVPGDAPKPSAPRPSLTRLPARRTSIVPRP